MISRLLKHNLFKNSATLIGGTAVAQLIPVVLQIFLRRVYGAEAFAAFALFVSLSGIFVIVATLRYEMAIVLPRKHYDSANLVAGGVIISFIINTVFMLAILLFRDQVVELIDFPETYAAWLYLLPVACFLMSVYQLMNYWLIRHKAFKASSVNKVVRRSAEGVVQLAGGVLKKASGLVWGNVIGSVANVGIGAYQLRKTRFKMKLVNLPLIVKNLKKYKEFPLYNMFPALLNTTSLLLPVFMISRYFNDHSVAAYDLTRQVLLVPSVFISISVSQVLLQQLSEKRNKGLSIRRELTGVLGILVFFAFIEIILLLFWGRELFGFVFGTKWTDAGYYAQILVAAFAAKFIVSPLSSVFIALEKLKISAIWQVLYFAVICSLWFYRDLPVEEFLFRYMIFDVIAYSIYLILIFGIVIRYEKTCKA